jgi:PIN domain nuclease of toxin-antitoxin system
VIVLDTHAWIYWLSASERLSTRARATIESAEAIGVSAISCWEVATLERRRRVDFAHGARAWVRDALERPNLALIHVGHEIAMRAGELVDAHGDPADRIIAATALLADAPLVTKDRKLAGFPGVKAIW